MAKVIVSGLHGALSQQRYLYESLIRGYVMRTIQLTSSQQARRRHHQRDQCMVHGLHCHVQGHTHTEAFKSSMPSRPRSDVALVNRQDCDEGPRLAQRCYLDIAVVAPSAIARANEAFKGGHGPTDVLSFPAVAERPLLPSSVTGVSAFAEGSLSLSSFSNDEKRRAWRCEDSEGNSSTPSLSSSVNRPPHPLSMQSLIDDIDEAECDSSSSSSSSSSSYPLSCFYPRRPVDLGSMLICPQYVRAKIARWPPRNMREPDYSLVALVHATLHLCGYRHEDDVTHTAMVLEERRVVRRLLMDVRSGRAPPFEFPPDSIDFPA